jgi:hypothetical protein
MTEFEKTLLKVQEIVADVTGNELDDIGAFTTFGDELGVTEPDMLRIVDETNLHFGIHLSLKLIEHEVETIQDLALLVHDEISLG